MSEFNFKSAVCTSREQSEKLLSLGLKPETADMRYDCIGRMSDTEMIYREKPIIGPVISYHDIPAWSLHKLLLLIPKEVNIDGFRFPLRSDAVMRMGEADDMYEYLIGVLERTIKEGYFPKEYLV